MANGVFIVGTDTDVGKTVVSAGLAMYLLHAGVRVGVMKPVASGCRQVGNALVSDDAVFLMEAAHNQFPSLTNPIRLREPLAPSVAAEIEGVTVSLEKIFRSYEKLSREYDFTIVEGVGGLCVPLYEQYMVADLIRDLGLPVLIVGRIGLGTINHTLLTVEALRERAIPIKGIILNGLRSQSASVAELTNPKVIQALSGVPVLGVLPWVERLAVAECRFGNLLDVFQKNITIDGWGIV